MYNGGSDPQRQRHLYFWMTHESLNTATGPSPQFQTTSDTLPIRAIHHLIKSVTHPSLVAFPCNLR